MERIFSTQVPRFGTWVSDFLFPLQPPPPLLRQTPRPVPPRKAWFRLHFGSVWLRLAPFGSVSALFRVRFGSVSGPWVGSGKGASVREKTITNLSAHHMLPGKSGHTQSSCEPLQSVFEILKMSTFQTLEIVDYDYDCYYDDYGCHYHHCHYHCDYQCHNTVISGVLRCSNSLFFLSS